MDMRIQNARLISRETLLISVTFLLGCVGLFASNYISVVWLSSTLHELSIALFIAAILALLIDRGLKHGLARDAFKTAFGYLLPEELRGELQWIYDQKLLCFQHSSHYELEHLEDGSVLIRSTVDRAFRNIGVNAVDFTPSLAIDEWRNRSRTSQILVFGYEANGARKELKGNEIPTEAIEFGVIRVKATNDVATPLPIAAGQVVRTWAVYEEVMASNDQHVSVYGSPTLNPHIRLSISNTLIARVDFGHRDKVHAKRLGPNVFQLEGLLLPNQAIRVEWRVKNQGDS